MNRIFRSWCPLRSTSGTNGAVPHLMGGLRRIMIKSSGKIPENRTEQENADIDNLGRFQFESLGRSPRSMFGIQLAEGDLRDSVMGKYVPKEPEPQEVRRIGLAALQLGLDGLNFNKNKVEPVLKGLEIPKLPNDDVIEYLHSAATKQIKPYQDMLRRPYLKDIPVRPTKFSLQPGWTRYELKSKPSTLKKNRAEDSAKETKEDIDLEDSAIEIDNNSAVENLDDSAIEFENDEAEDSTKEVGNSPAEEIWEITSVPYPLETSITFDIENNVIESQYPTLAVAVTDKAWYSWCSDKISIKAGFEPLSKNPETQLIPFNNVKSVIIGHNTCYDRARIENEYSIRPSELRFVDTMSMHITLRGMTIEQRKIYMKHQSDLKQHQQMEMDYKEQTPGEFDDVLDESDSYQFEDSDTSLLNDSDIPVDECVSHELENSEIQATEKKTSQSPDKKETSNAESFTNQFLLDQDDRFGDWVNHTCLNSLSACVNFYLNRKLDKSARDVFVTGTYDDVYENIQDSFHYCALDVEATLELYQKLYIDYTLASPSNISWAGTLQLGSTALPLDGVVLDHFIELCDKKFDEIMGEVRNILADLAYKALEKTPGEIENDDFLKHLDWSLQKKPKDPYRADKPLWFRELLDDENQLDITTRKRVTPYLLQLKWRHKVHENGVDVWKDSPLRYDSFLVRDGDQEIAPRKACWGYMNDTYGTPLKNGINYCGNPLAKGYQDKIIDGTLHGHEEALHVLQAGIQTTYWNGVRKRLESQFSHNGVVVPMLQPAGTITRRAVEATWLTASNAKKNKIGTELKSKIQAPPGYSFVGADVDSQELWISAILGDCAAVGAHGATSFGWMTVSGDKAAGTDLHSYTAQIIGVSRDQAKVFNYGRIYGAGKKSTAQQIEDGDPTLPDGRAQELSDLLFASTKGKSGMRNDLNLHAFKRVTADVGPHGQAPVKDGEKIKNIEVVPDSPQYAEVKKKLDQKETEEAAQSESLTKNGVAQKGLMGGSESAMFNTLTALSTSQYPVTPFLGVGLTKVLRSDLTGTNFMTSRNNWIVQSSAVDFLHLLIVCMNDLCSKFDIDARFTISIHDEVRFLVKDEDRYRACLALHFSNYYTRTFMAKRIGMNDLPISTAFFSQVDVDKVLRKEVFFDCLTLSNDLPVPVGENLDIYHTIKKTNGSLRKEDQPKHSQMLKEIQEAQEVSLKHVPHIHTVYQNIYSNIDIDNPDGIKTTTKEGVVKTWTLNEEEKLEFREEKELLDTWDAYFKTQYTNIESNMEILKEHRRLKHEKEQRKVLLKKQKTEARLKRREELRIQAQEKEKVNNYWLSLDLTCPRCQKKFKTPSGVRRHFDDNKCQQKPKPPEPEELAKTSVLEFVDKLQCKFCFKKFKSKSNIERHLSQRICLDKPLFQCLPCAKTFKTKATLQRHDLQSHPGYQRMGPGKGRLVKINENDKVDETNEIAVTESHQQEHLVGEGLNADADIDMEAITVELKNTATQKATFARTTTSTTVQKTKVTFACPFCDLSYQSKSSLKRHVKGKHKVSLD